MFRYFEKLVEKEANLKLKHKRLFAVILIATTIFNLISVSIKIKKFIDNYYVSNVLKKSIRKKLKEYDKKKDTKAGVTGMDYGCPIGI